MIRFLVNIAISVGLYLLFLCLFSQIGYIHNNSFWAGAISGCLIIAILNWVYERLNKFEEEEEEKKDENDKNDPSILP
jgi:Na+-driven multidrug efflux pump